jgi:hypothetical protein
MILTYFQEFYFQQFPNSKERSKSLKNRVNDHIFLEYIFGNSKNIIENCSLTEISRIKNGYAKPKVTKAFTKKVISDIEEIISNDMETSGAQYLDVAFAAKNKIEKDLTLNENTKILHSLFSNPLDASSVVKGIKWWLIFSILQEEVGKYYEDYYNELNNGIIKSKNNQNLHAINTINKFLEEKGITVSTNSGRKCAEVSYKHLHELRRLLIDTAKGKIYIAGETLGNAFSARNSGDAPIIKNLLSAVKSRQIEEINVFVMDPSIFSSQQLNEPIDTLSTSIISLIDQLKISLHHNCCKLKIHFLPYLNIDHAVITDSFMLFRSTKLWTNEKDLKGSVMLYFKYDNVDGNNFLEETKDSYDSGEYNAHKKYLDKISENSVLIDTTKEYEISTDLSRDRHIHYDIRNSVYKAKKNGNNFIELYKVYRSQLNQIAISSFSIDKTRFVFNFNDKITSQEDLFNPKNLLNDNTQRILLPYIKATEKAFNELIKKYDNRDESGVTIIPSLDLGYPNNVMRLAGGFATGMLIDWECGTPLIPIDATVNICSSSVFKLDNLDEFLSDFEGNLKNIFTTAVSTYGYSFSFNSGNHFLMIATDDENQYYLVLHSSVKDMKESYFGLYPKEVNWYSSRVQTFIDSDNRCIRYIKDDDAKHFIKKAHNLEKYNEEMHKWIAKAINMNNSPSESIIKHHYYMPTDSSIALGTFVESPGEVVPIFSDIHKPVYLFRISENNWTYNLGGKQVCIVPHGWGQQIESIDKIESINKKLRFVFKDKKYVEYDMVSTARIDNRININFDENNNKQIRKFESIDDFLKKGTVFLKGEIIKTLTPQYLYCKNYVGKCTGNNQ